MGGVLTPLSSHNSLGFNRNLIISMHDPKEIKPGPKFLKYYFV